MKLLTPKRESDIPTTPAGTGCVIHYRCDCESDPTIAARVQCLSVNVALYTALLLPLMDHNCLVYMNLICFCDLIGNCDFFAEPRQYHIIRDSLYFYFE